MAKKTVPKKKKSFLIYLQDDLHKKMMDSKRKTQLSITMQINMIIRDHFDRNRTTLSDYVNGNQ
jgi:hypothetical protein